MSSGPAPSRALSSLLDALQAGREAPVPAAAWAAVASRFLDADETVLLALEAEGWTVVDPVLLVTDRRVLHLRRGAVLPFRQHGEIPASSVASVSLTPSVLGPRIRVVARAGRDIVVRARRREDAHRFVDGLTRLLASRA